MNLVRVAHAWEQSVAEDAMHDIQKGVQHPSRLAIGEHLLNKEWLKQVRVSRLRVGVGANTNGCVKLVIRNVKQIHELLPCSRQLTAVGHPGHPPLLSGMKVH